MKTNNSQKASVITFFLTGTLILSVFNLNLIPDSDTSTSLSKEKDVEYLVEMEELQPKLKDNSPKTNKGYNKAEKLKHYAQAFKPIAPPKDYDDSRLKANRENPSKVENASKNNANSSIKNNELTAFNSVNSILNKRSIKKEHTNSKASANTNSSIHYSLKGRIDEFLPIPIYLCEENGKIVVSITVNANGKVTSADINTASNSKNQCLIDHALEYALEARFNDSNKKSQIGTITFYFEGKIK